MCGFAAILSGNKGLKTDTSIVHSMINAIAHRGPDERGLKECSNQAIFSHCRLSIIDIYAGQQPAVDRSDRYCLVFNGEIYNYKELKLELEQAGEIFESNSDTEVLLKLLVKFGQDALHKLNGMFSFIFYDQVKKSWIAARDHFGIKPLYYISLDQEIIFASEIKALLTHPDIEASVNKDALGDYLTFQFCFGDNTLFQNIIKVEPGQAIFGEGNRIVKKEYYWDNNYHFDEYHSEKFFEDELRNLLFESIALQMRSDVPVGAYLSGGLDSSIVSVLASKQIRGPLEVFHGRFTEGEDFDESTYARSLANYVSAKYNEVTPTANDFVEMMPKIIFALDEPVAGPGVFPQFMVSKLASQHVKVVLGGQGGDEIFAGYTRYLVAYFEQVLKGAIYGTNQEGKHLVTLDSIVPNLSMLRQYVPMMQHLFADGLFKNMDLRYFKLVDRSQGLEDLLGENGRFILKDYDAFEKFTGVFNKPETESYINKMTYFDQKTLLPALLQIEDRVSMQASIESRVPLLDRRIIELVSTMPPAFKFKGGEPKSIFKKVSESLVPKDIYERKDKMGFPVPLSHWMEGGPVRDFVADTLLSKKSLERGVYKKKSLMNLIESPGLAARQIWGALCLEMWHSEFIDNQTR